MQPRDIDNFDAKLFSLADTAAAEAQNSAAWRDISRLLDMARGRVLDLMPADMRRRATEAN